jgi:hypothetical protein
MKALISLIRRCNEMDITEQLNWLGDASMPYQAKLELADLQARLAEAERKAAMTFIPAGEWDICTKHNRAYESKEGCQSCRIEELEADRDEREYQIQDAITQITDWRDRAYPLDIFPEPDLKKVREMLGDNLISLVSASNMRHVTTRTCEILAAALAKGENK